MPAYQYQVLAGSTRQINVNITGGTLNTVNWSVLSTTGGASATFTTPSGADVSSVAAGLPTVQVNIGPEQGNCSISGTTKFTVSSTASVTVQAQSVDDPAKTAAFLFNVCANSPATLANGTSSVIVAPAYQQAYQSQPMTLQSWVAGCVDETGTWSIVSEPSGGNGTLADATNRDTVFSASVTGRYTIQYTANCNSGTNTAIVYVSPNKMPAYASTPNGTRPHECYVDPELTGADYEVGAGKTYTTISSTPALTGFKPGTIMRIWNTDTSGSNPSVYPEYYDIQSSGTPSQPIIVCGVADVNGNLPIMDGTNATAQSDVATNQGGGIITLWPGSNPFPFGYWEGGSLGPRYISITGLHLRNANSTIKHYLPGSSSATNWDNFTACINFHSGSYVDISGVELDNCSNGLFSDDNDSNGWATITQNLTFIGNHVQLLDAAVMMSANKALSHYPPTNWLLYTAAGATAAANSDISLGTEGPAAIDGFIGDAGSNNTAIGHRRWLLYPQTKTMGTGNVDAVNGFYPADATWVLDGNYGTTRPAVRDNFVAWPPPGYVPYQVVYARWSFAYPGAVFTSATTVTMTSGGNSVPVALEALDNPAYGENTIVWDYNGLDGNTDFAGAAKPSSDTVYNVQVNDVVINGIAQNFSYDVTVFDPAVAGTGDSPPTVMGPSQVSTGRQMDYVVAGLPPFAGGYEYRAITSLTPATAVFGAEGGLQGVIPDISDAAGTSTEAYNPVDTSVSFSGSASYHLAQPDATTQTLTLPGYFFFAGGSASLNFETLLGLATSHQTARAQVSTDDGATWTDVFSQSGIDTPNTPTQTSFQSESVSLGAYADLPFQVRFAYTFDGSGPLYEQTTSGVGWNIDAITLVNVDNAAPGVPAPYVAGNILGYTAASAGAAGLQARAVLAGTYPDSGAP